MRLVSCLQLGRGSKDQISHTDIVSTTDTIAGSPASTSKNGQTRPQCLQSRVNRNRSLSADNFRNGADMIMTPWPY